MSDNTTYENRFKSIFDSINTGIILIDIDTHRIADANPAAISMIGGEKDTIVGKECHHFICSSEKGKCPILDLKQQKNHSEREIIQISGKVVPVIKTFNQIELSGRSYLLESFIDLSNVKNINDENTLLKKRLDQAQRIESLGTLAGGIAHDFNNILYAAIGFTELALADVRPKSRAATCLGHIMTAHKRATDLINQILTFSRKSKKELQPVFIQSILKESLKLMETVIPANIEIKQKINMDCGPVLSDPTRIHQVIMNLCTNAYQAMQKKGGRLTVKLQSIFATEGNTPPGLSLKKMIYIVLEVSDTGVGIDDETKERMFDPFFTTKEVGSGSGMGLSTVHGIVKDYGGAIHVETKPGCGASFYIYLPECEPDEASVEASREVADLKGNETILFVDDEMQIKLFVEKALSKNGYTVYISASSTEALETFRLAPGHFDVVVTDYNMPGLNGIDLARKILKIRPDMPVLLCSGYSNEFIEKEALEIGIKNILEKPVITNDLLKAIRNVINSSH